MSPTWETTTDWDAAQSAKGAIHEQPTGTDYPTSDTVAKGYPGDWTTWGTIPTPVALYPLEDDGSAANEITGNGIDGSITGATATAGGPFGRSHLDFDGTDDEVSVDASAVTTYDGGANGNKKLSISAWVNPATLTGDHLIVGAIATADDDPFEFYVDSTGNLHLTFGDNNARNFSSTGTLSTGTWQHVGANYNSDGNDGAFFINGAQDSTFGQNTNENVSVDTFKIGGGAGRGFFDGGIAQVVYWSLNEAYVASATEMSEIYQAAV